MEYRQIQDTAGIAPTVSIQSPQAGTTLSQGRRYKIRIDAEDDVQVAGVEIIINGEVIDTDLEAPYETVYRMPDNESGITLSARAIDLAGNTADTPEQVYSLIPANENDELWDGVTINTIDQDLTTRNIDLIQGNYIEPNYTLTATGDLTITALTAGGTSKIQVKELFVEGDLIIDGATLEIATSKINVLGDLRLINGAILTVPYASGNPYLLHLAVGNQAQIDSGSKIYLKDRGYVGGKYHNYAGPDYAHNSDRYACHGGNREGAMSDCTYGRYEKARFAGSSANRYRRGGGYLLLEAKILALDGRIDVRGQYDRDDAAGAGGGVACPGNYHEWCRYN